MLAIAASWLETQLRRRVIPKGQRRSAATFFPAGPGYAPDVANVRARLCAAREAKRAVLSLVRCRKGVVAFEFVLVAPVFFLVLLATMYLGLALDNYVILTAAAGQGAQNLASARGLPTPYTSTTAIISTVGASLTQTKVTTTVKIGAAGTTAPGSATACNTDSTCSTLLTTDGPGAVAFVILTYPCNLTIMGIAFAGSPCTLSAQSAAFVY